MLEKQEYKTCHEGQGNELEKSTGADLKLGKATR